MHGELPRTMLICRMPVPWMRAAMSDVASSLAWCSIGIVDGDWKLRKEAMVGDKTPSSELGVELGIKQRSMLCDGSGYSIDMDGVLPIFTSLSNVAVTCSLSGCCLQSCNGHIRLRPVEFLCLCQTLGVAGSPGVLTPR